MERVPQGAPRAAQHRHVREELQMLVSAARKSTGGTTVDERDGETLGPARATLRPHEEERQGREKIRSSEEEDRRHGHHRSLLATHFLFQQYPQRHQYEAVTEWYVARREVPTMVPCVARSSPASTPSCRRQLCAPPPPWFRRATALSPARRGAPAQRFRPKIPERSRARRRAADALPVISSWNRVICPVRAIWPRARKDDRIPRDEGTR